MFDDLCREAAVDSVGRTEIDLAGHFIFLGPHDPDTMRSKVRYEAKLEDDVLYVEHDDGWLKIAPIETVVELIGGETYTLEYDDRAAAVSWLNTDENDTISFDVRETILELTYLADFVGNLKNCPVKEPGDTGYPKRAELFADLVTAIWDAKGNLDK